MYYEKIYRKGVVMALTEKFETERVSNKGRMNEVLEKALTKELDDFAPPRRRGGPQLRRVKPEERGWKRAF